MPPKEEKTTAPLEDKTKAATVAQPQSFSAADRLPLPVTYASDQAAEKIITRVHNDDIHGIVPTNGKIISGSKDSNVKIFDNDGRFEFFIPPAPALPDQEFRVNENWVTALDSFRDGSFICGYRNGCVFCSSLDGNTTYFSRALYNPSTQLSYRYKQRNQNRITGAKCLPKNFGEYTVLVGIPEMFFHIDCSSGRILSTFRFGQAEWVYDFAAIGNNRVATIHGCGLSIMQSNAQKWQRVATLVDPNSASYDYTDQDVDDAISIGMQALSVKDKDTSAAKAQTLSPPPSTFKESIPQKKPFAPTSRHQRPFISSVNCFGTNQPTTLLALSFFGGVNQALDIESGKIVHHCHEHRDRVWRAVPFTNFEYVTCADDRTIKIWDIRQPISVCTYGNHPGRVSSLAFLDCANKKFVAGTCPDNPQFDPNKGQFYFYDLRRGRTVSSSTSATTTDASLATILDSKTP